MNKIILKAKIWAGKKLFAAGTNIIMDVMSAAGFNSFTTTKLLLKNIETIATARAYRRKGIKVGVK